MEDVTPLLSKTACYCLNESVPQEYTHLFVGDHTLTLKSDADEQLLLHLGFNQTVALKQIVFGVPADDTCPNNVKLFINKNSLGFSDASGMISNLALPNSLTCFTFALFFLVSYCLSILKNP
ncbi:hypothetical protein EON65_36280 [archaeon]|nr:MAG: hypothetical protein EON65_36280 [archaeon]